MEKKILLSEDEKLDFEQIWRENPFGVLKDPIFFKCNNIVCIESVGYYLGIPYITTFVRQHRCGYVGVDDDIPQLDKSFHLSVHGGFTYREFSNPWNFNFGKKYWFGFHCAHSSDLPDFPSAIKYGFLPQDYLVPIGMGDSFHECKSETRTLEYVISECKFVIDQLLEEELIERQGELKC